MHLFFVLFVCFACSVFWFHFDISFIVDWTLRICYQSVPFGVEFSFFSPLTDWVVEGKWTAIQQRPVFSVRGHRGQFWEGQGFSLFNFVHQAFPLLTTALPSLQGAPKDGFGQAVLCVACQNHASFHLLAIARRCSCGPTRKLTLPCTRSLILSSKWWMRRSFLRHLVLKPGSFFSKSASRIHVSQP